MDEIEQLIEPAAGIFGRPLAQLGPHSSYPSLRPKRVGPPFTGIHQYLRHPAILPEPPTTAKAAGFDLTVSGGPAVAGNARLGLVALIVF